MTSPPAVIRDIPDLFSFLRFNGKDDFATTPLYLSHILTFCPKRMRLEGF